MGPPPWLGKPYWDKDDLWDAVMTVWKPLSPALDEKSLTILDYLINSSGVSLYKIARDLGMSFSLVYKKGQKLLDLRLIHRVDEKRFMATVKACIASLVNGWLDKPGFINCLKARWPLEALDIREEEILSFLYVLGMLVAARGLDLVKATICGFDEASLHVFKLYVSNTIVSHLIAGSVEERLKRIGVRMGVSKDIVAAAFRTAVKGIMKAMPPTMDTGRHKIIVAMTNGSPQVIAVDCRTRCKYYMRELGLTCPLVAREVAEVLAKYSMATRS